MPSTLSLRIRALVALLLIALLALSASCTDEVGARRALQRSGYTEIRLEGWAGCSCNGYETGTSFRAKNPAGQEVEGVVCCGYFLKGCTVRF
jgi:hypothetical protein